MPTKIPIVFTVTPKVRFPVTAAVASKASQLNLAIVSKANKSGAFSVRRAKR